jgi:integrase/recombinase XerD
MILESWLAVRPVWSLTLFCALSWGYTGQPLTNSGLNQLLRRLAGKAEITGRFNPHSFRHAFGIEMILAGADSAIVSKIMGHSSIKVTVDTYGNFGDDRRLSDHHDKFTLLREVDL